MLLLISLVVLFVAIVWLFMQQPQFGKAPSGNYLEGLKRSPNYRDGAFQNLSHTPALKEGVSYFTVTRKFFFGKSPFVKPPVVLPSAKTDLSLLDPAQDVIVWFGHSSYFLQLHGKRILVDPVFSGHASPVSTSTRSFNGADVYTVADMPPIDFLFITHDHYDHLCHKTVAALRTRVTTVVTGLGVGAHLQRWGYSSSNIIERDWNEQVDLGDGFLVTYAPSRHFSGRGFKRNISLWTSFVLQTPDRKLYLGGDSGYDSHFAAIGAQHGPFDLVILENGQYNEYWKYIHMMPEEVVQAATDLRAKRLFPVHWSKFALSLHNWDEPIKRVVAEAARKGMPLMHPLIGQVVPLDDAMQHTEWWHEVK
jgi:L-ascorbate metabolism protein UlaG (beta-lactamase superfamily)